MRLAKYLAHCGVASRRGAEQVIAQGRVTVAGQRVLDPARDVDGTEPVLVDGEPVTLERRTLVLAMNKPAGVVSTARDTHGRQTVVDLAGERGVRLYPVGRLDADSTGLLLLTNDGELANRLMHPRYEVPRTYRALVSNAPVSSAALNALRRGVTLDDGTTAPAQARRIAPNVIELVLHEGRKRQVRRMCEAVGHPVRSLQRVAFGSLVLGDLREGAVRTLRAKEIEALRAATTPQPEAAGRPKGRPGRRPPKVPAGKRRRPPSPGARGSRSPRRG
jgi:23S rRNA pseudouridine2605 synthase